MTVNSWAVSSSKELLDKVCDGKTAATMIQPGDILESADLHRAAIRKSRCMNWLNVMKQTAVPGRYLDGRFPPGSQIDGELVEVTGSETVCPTRLTVH